MASAVSQSRRIASHARAPASIAGPLSRSRLCPETVEALLTQHVENASRDPNRAHAMYHDDAVLEFPQSGERFEGVENLREWRSNYPASTKVEFREIRGGGDVWVV